MTDRRRVIGRVASCRNLAVAVMAAAAVALSGCAQPGSGPTGDPKPQLVPLQAVATSALNPANAPRWSSLLHSSQKFFGVSLNGAPASTAPVRAFARHVRKAPNVIEYYQDWGNPFDPARATRACGAGMLPVLTWESWDWHDLSGGATAVTQPSHAPRRIAAGDFDSYINATAQAIKSVKCTLVIRFDQEPNGSWYPWGLGTAGMNNTAAQYTAMWRHVWKLFHAAGVQNVVWCWSPNMLSPVRSYPLHALYPGNRYVDAVGLDGYLLAPNDTLHTVLGRVMRTIRPFAGTRPWFVSETGVASGPSQARNVTSLLHDVAASKRLRGLIYLDQPAHRADWSIDSHPDSLRAFRRGIGIPTYGGASR